MSTIPTARIALVACALLIIASCANVIARFAYNNVDWWVVDYVDDYFDLSTAQDKQLTDILSQVRPWHRKVMLPQIALFLQRIKQYAATDTLSLADVRLLGQSFMDLKTQHIDKLLPAATDFLVTVTEPQIAHARSHAAERHAERVEMLAENEYVPQLQEHLRDRFVTLFGSINKVQGAIIAAHLTNAVQFRTWQLAEFTRTRTWFFGVLKRAQRKEITKTEMVQALRPRFETPEDYFAEPYKTAWHQRRTDAYRMVVALHNSLSQSQKQHFTTTVDDYIALVDSLLVAVPVDQTAVHSTN